MSVRTIAPTVRGAVMTGILGVQLLPPGTTVIVSVIVVGMSGNLPTPFRDTLMRLIASVKFGAAIRR